MINSERETSLVYSDDDEVIYIYSCVRRDITAMKKKSQFTVEEEGKYKDGTPWAKFSIPMDRFDISRGAKTTRNLSPEARAKLSSRMTKLHAKNKED